MSGWSKLGSALAGVSDADRADIQAKTMNALAQRDANVARARQEMMKARAQSGLGARFGELGMEHPEALADVAISGVNYNTLTGGLGKQQEQDFRRAAVEAAVRGDYGGSNAQLLGVANGPVALPSVQGGMLLSNRLVPGGGTAVVTPVGQAQIGADNARGQAAMIRAERGPASRASGGGRAPAAVKISEVDKYKLKSIQEKMKDATYALEAGRGADKVAAQDALDALMTQEAAILGKYDDSAPLSGRLAPEPSTAEEPMPAMDGDTWYNDPQTGEQRKVPGAPPAARNARVTQVQGRPVVSVTSPTEAKAAWAKLAPGAGLKLPNGTIRWKE